MRGIEQYFFLQYSNTLSNLFSYIYGYNITQLLNDESEGGKSFQNLKLKEKGHQIEIDVYNKFDEILVFETLTRYLIVF